MHAICRPPPSEECQRDLIGAWHDAPTEACPLAAPSVVATSVERGPGVIVIGVDPHKQTHTAVAVEAGVGVLREERTVAARARGHEQLLAWARTLDGERLWALEDCRHVTRGLERTLQRERQRWVRVPSRLTAPERRGGGASVAAAIALLATVRSGAAHRLQI